MADHDAAMASVVGLPERLANREIRLTGTVKPSMGRTPAVGAVKQRQLVQSMQPLMAQGCA